MKTTSSENIFTKILSKKKSTYRLIIYIIIIIIILGSAAFGIFIFGTGSFNLHFLPSQSFNSYEIATINQEIECFKGITIKISDVSYKSNLITITAEGHNNNDYSFTFKSGNFVLSGQDTENYNNHGLLSPAATWKYIVNANSSFKFYQSYTIDDNNYSYTLTLYDENHTKAGQFLLVSDNQ